MSKHAKQRRLTTPSASTRQPLPNSRYTPPRSDLRRFVTLTAALLTLLAGGCFCLCGCETLKSLRKPANLDGSKLQWDPTNGVTGNVQLNGAQVDNIPTPPPPLPTPPLLEAAPLTEARYTDRALAATLEK